MIIELFGPPGVGKTTLRPRLCRAMAKRGINVKTVNGYRQIESGASKDDGPEVRHGIGRIGKKLAASGHILLSNLPKDSLAAQLLAAFPVRSLSWSWRMKVDIALLCESWRQAAESDGHFIFEEGLIQALCALAVLARGRSTDVVRGCLSFLPRPDLLIQLDAPQETLRRRLTDRHARQPLLEVLLELGVDKGLRQASISREIGRCLRQAGWPLIKINGAEPQDFDEIIRRVLEQHDAVALRA
ncbi:sulfate adenylyltransferase [Mesorhizobium sp. WSM4310]|uniref:sulfate adenylyltransferase n=1 Tax=Mesorhizobium sp. WSM4310 TaxID=2589883 RepID=UPI00115DEECE|nr:sulfate adenylyltransferase [Mesorhizobium sp. WSM4310]TRC78492.1 sulfate adenylyltransferase [Mesorhizobium sp. WSM4310]